MVLKIFALILFNQQIVTSDLTLTGLHDLDNIVGVAARAVESLDNEEWPVSYNMKRLGVKGYDDGFIISQLNYVSRQFLPEEYANQIITVGSYPGFTIGMLPKEDRPKLTFGMLKSAYTKGAEVLCAGWFQDSSSNRNDDEHSRELLRTHCLFRKAIKDIGFSDTVQQAYFINLVIRKLKLGDAAMADSIVPSDRGRPSIGLWLRYGSEVALYEKFKIDAVGRFLGR